MKTLLSITFLFCYCLCQGQWTTLHTDASGDSGGLDATVLEYMNDPSSEFVLFRVTYTNLSSYSSGPAADFSFFLPNGLESGAYPGTHWTSTTLVHKTAYIYCDPGGSPPIDYTFNSWAQTIEETDSQAELCSHCVDILVEESANQITYFFNRQDIISDIEMDGNSSATIGLVANVGHDIGWDDAITHEQGGDSKIAFTIDISLSVSMNAGIKQIDIFPNPVNDRFYLTDSDNMSSIKVFDILGKEVAQFSLQNKENGYDVSSLQSGVYLILFQDDYGFEGMSKFFKL